MKFAGALLSAEDYLAMPNNHAPNELVRGRVIPMDVPFPRHGQICGQIIWIIGRFLEDHNLGHLVCDSGVITERTPDTVRGVDVAFYSYQRVSPGPLPWTYLDVAPELVFGVRSPTDR